MVNVALVRTALKDGRAMASGSEIEEAADPAVPWSVF